MHRLMSSRRSVNNGQPRISQHDLTTLRNSLVVRPTMSLRLIHPHNNLFITVAENARDTTHLSPPLAHNGRIAPPHSPTCAHSHFLAPLPAVHPLPPLASRATTPLHHQPERANHSVPSAQIPTPLPSDPSQSPATPPLILPAPPNPIRRNAKAHTTHPQPHTHAATHANL